VTRDSREPVGGWRQLGPGIVVAATGVGAGDLVAAAVCGARYGHELLWTAVVGALLKFALTDGLARWQLASGSTLIEGWATRLGRVTAAAVLLYVVLWTLVVAAALMSACGLAVHAVFPAIPVAAGGVLHALAALALVWSGRYGLFERTMKWFVGIMFVAIVGSVLRAPPAPAALLAGLVPRAPAGSLAYALAVLGGVGGTVTIVSYGYWMRERGWSGRAMSRVVRLDLGVAYVLTGIFGCAVMVLAAEVLHGSGLEVKGREAALVMAEMLGEHGGRTGRAVFLAGFWGAVASSLLGVWQGVPYLVADLWKRLGHGGGEPSRVSTTSHLYRGYLLFMSTVPMLFLVLEPVGLVILYAALGALFMPFLAVTLLVMLNRRSWMRGARNGPVSNLLLVVSLGVFVYLGGSKLLDLIAR
jgi:Mn2+/Fe2+ NRAMP family transporter